VLIDRFLEEATEIDVDAVADGHQVIIGGVMEHIEEAGVHSGDSACAIPPFSLPEEVIEEICEATRRLALHLRVQGLMNVQYAVKEENGRSTLYVLEVNPRASRTVPFVSKAVGIPLAKVATRVMLGQSLAEQGLLRDPTPVGVAVKEAVFPFVKFAGVDIILGPEMKSTGEVMGVAENFPLAFAKSQIAAGTFLPLKGTVLVSVADRHKRQIVDIARRLAELGFQLVATRGTAKCLAEAGIEALPLKKIQQGHPNPLDLIYNGEIQLIVNTPSGKGARTDEGKIRAAAVARGIAYVTTIQAAEAAVEAMAAMRGVEMTVEALQDRFPHLRRKKTLARVSA